MSIAINSTFNEIFRKARKYGFNATEYRDLVKKCGTDAEGNSNAIRLIEFLENKYIEILEENNVLDFI